MKAISTKKQPVWVVRSEPCGTHRTSKSKTDVHTHKMQLPHGSKRHTVPQDPALIKARHEFRMPPSAQKPGGVVPILRLRQVRPLRSPRYRRRGGNHRLRPGHRLRQSHRPYLFSSYLKSGLGACRFLCPLSSFSSYLLRCVRVCATTYNSGPYNFRPFDTP